MHRRLTPADAARADVHPTRRERASNTRRRTSPRHSVDRLGGVVGRRGRFGNDSEPSLCEWRVPRLAEPAGAMAARLRALA
jgi:hypothetical protein